jgi:hypothetical protein
MHTAQIREFLGAIADGRQPRPSGDDGRIVMHEVGEVVRSAGAD